MSIELIQKQTSRERVIGAVKLKSWSSVLVGVLILSLISYGGLFGYKKYLEGGIDDLNNQIVEMSQRRDPAIEERVESLDKQITGLKDIIRNRLYWSKVFTAIEELTLPQLYFSNFTGEIDNSGLGLISLDALTVSFNEAAKETQLFKDGLFFKNIRVNSLLVNEDGEINFSLNAEFNEGDLKD